MTPASLGQQGRARRLARSATMVFVAAVGVGCDGRGTTCIIQAGGQCAQSTDLNTFLDQLTQAMCSWQFRCCSLPEIDAIGSSSYLTETECRTVTNHALQMQASELRVAFAQGRLSLDPKLAASCIDQIKNGLCNAPPTDQNSVVLLAWDRASQCPSPFVGRLATDAECFLVDECQPGSSCTSGGSLLDSKVTSGGIRSVPILNDSFAEAPRGHCQLDSKEGEACMLSSQCVPGLYCRRTDFVCARPVGEGQPCSVQLDPNGAPVGVTCSESPEPLICAGDHCRRMPRADEPCLPMPVSGLLCEPSDNPPLTCVGQGLNGTGICKALAQRGDACSVQNGLPPCEPPLGCFYDETGIGTCDAAPPPGSPCAPDRRCAPPGVCYQYTGLCVLPPLVRDGAACRSDLDCASLTCATVSNIATDPGGCAINPVPPLCIGPGAFVSVETSPPVDGPDAGTTAGADAIDSPPPDARARDAGMTVDARAMIF